MRVRPQVFKRGIWVWYYNPRRFRHKSPKWQRNYTGPFLVIKNLDPVNVVLQLNRRAKPFVTHVDKLKRCLGETPLSWIDQEMESQPSHVNEDLKEEESRRESLDGFEMMDMEQYDDIEVEDVQSSQIPRSRYGRPLRLPIRYRESASGEV